MEKVGFQALGLYQKGLHAAYSTNRFRLPGRLDFAVSHGITVKVGDSHPNAVEVIAEFPLRRSV